MRAFSLRSIVSMTEGVSDILEALVLAIQGGLSEIDATPLFETVADLERARFAVRAGQLGAPQERHAGRVEPAELAFKTRVDTRRVTMPDVDRQILERRAGLVLHSHDQAHRQAASVLRDVLPDGVEVEVERPFGLPRVERATVRAARSAIAYGAARRCGAFVRVGFHPFIFGILVPDCNCVLVYTGIHLVFNVNFTVRDLGCFKYIYWQARDTDKIKIGGVVISSPSHFGVTPDIPVKPHFRIVTDYKRYI